ncbi:hypothetical protein [Streptomyces collinus]|uniref:hypothetical protein n=1 Tax=Streptomyces collinus TaxID=42684 RepID=UPI00380772C0
MAGAPLLGSVPAGSGALAPAGFRTAAPHWLAPQLDGSAPDLTARRNPPDQPDVAGAPLLGSVPAGSGRPGPAGFRTAAPHWLAPQLDGSWDAEAFRVREAPEAF